MKIHKNVLYDLTQEQLEILQVHKVDNILLLFAINQTDIHLGNVTEENSAT